MSLEELNAHVQVEEKRRQHGFNELAKAPGKPMWRLVLEQFDDMMVKVSSRLPPKSICCRAAHCKHLLICSTGAAQQCCCVPSEACTCRMLST